MKEVEGQTREASKVVFGMTLGSSRPQCGLSTGANRHKVYNGPYLPVR